MGVIHQWCSMHGLHPQKYIESKTSVGTPISGVRIDGHDYYELCYDIAVKYKGDRETDSQTKPIKEFACLSMMDKIYLRRIQYTHNHTVEVKPLVKPYTNGRMQVMCEDDTSSLSEKEIIGVLSEGKNVPRYFDRAILDIDYTILGIMGSGLYCILKDPCMGWLQAQYCMELRGLDTLIWTSNSNLQNENLSL